MGNQKAQVNDIVKVKADFYHQLPDGAEAKVIDADRFNDGEAVRVRDLKSGMEQTIAHRDYRIVQKANDFKKGDFVRVETLSYSHNLRLGSIAKVTRVSLDGDLDVVGIGREDGRLISQTIANSSAVKVEDVVRAVEDGCDITEDAYYEVVERDCTGDPVIIDNAGDEQSLCSSEYEEVEKPKHKKDLKPKAGDKVKVVKAWMTGGDYKDGDIFTIKEVVTDGVISVEEHSTLIALHEVEILSHQEPKIGENVEVIEEAPEEASEEAQTQPPKVGDIVTGNDVHGFYTSNRKFRLTAKRGEDAFYYDPVNCEGPMDDFIYVHQIGKVVVDGSIIEQAEKDVDDLTARMSSGRNEDEGNETFRYYRTVPFFHINKRKGVVTAIVKGASLQGIREKGFAKCSPQDTFVEEIGKAIALRRALGLAVPSEYIDLTPKTTKEVDRRAKVGEKIKVVSPVLSDGSYEKGDILTVKEVENGGVYVEEATIGLFHSEYVVIEEKGAPKMKEVKRPAKVGEKIKIVAPYLTAGEYHKGDILTVTEVKDCLEVGAVRVEGVDITIALREYVVLESNIKEGDKVRITGNGDNNDTILHNHEVGSIGEVIRTGDTYDAGFKTIEGPNVVVRVDDLHQIVSLDHVELV